MQEYVTMINICYGRQIVALQTQGSSGLTWVVAKAVGETSHLVVQHYILNQSCGYWLLSDALYATFHISTRLQNKYDWKMHGVPRL